MKKLKVVLFLLIILFSFNVNVFGLSNFNSVMNQNNIDIIKEEKNIADVDSLTDSVESFMDELGSIFDITRLRTIDFKEMMLNPLMLFWIFIKAFIIVILINIIAKVVCKIMFNYSEVLKSRRKSRKLNKVLRDLYE